MMKSFRVYQVDAFTRSRFTGNAAGVVPNADGLSERDMLAIARELNNSETAFVFPPSGDDHDLVVRFFTPTVEVPVCGHATIAANFVLACEGSTHRRVRMLTGAGILMTETEPTPAGNFRIWMTQLPGTFGQIVGGQQLCRLLAALGLDEDDLTNKAAVQVISTGHSKVMVQISDRPLLDTLHPDMPALALLSAEIGCNGYYVFTTTAPETGAFAHARMFAPAIGINEDPVTGNGAGPLGVYLVEHGQASLDESGKFAFRVIQGEAIKRRGSVDVEVSRPSGSTATRVRIAGEAVIVFQSSIEL